MNDRDRKQDALVRALEQELDDKDSRLRKQFDAEFMPDEKGKADMKEVVRADRRVIRTLRRKIQEYRDDTRNKS